MLVRGGSDVLERTREKACMLRVGVFDSIRVRGMARDSGEASELDDACGIYSIVLMFCFYLIYRAEGSHIFD